jgi:hypothetical protein
MVSFASLPLYSRGNSPRHSLYRRLSGPREVWTLREKNPLPKIEPRPLGRPARSIVLPTQLSRLYRPEMGTSSIDWTQLRFYLKPETESSLRNVVLKINRTVFLDKDKTMDNVQKHNICTIISKYIIYIKYRLHKVL